MISMWEPIVNSAEDSFHSSAIIENIFETLLTRIKDQRDFSLYFGSGGICLLLALYKSAYINQDGQDSSRSICLTSVINHLIDNAQEAPLGSFSDYSNLIELGSVITFLQHKRLLNFGVDHMCEGLDSCAVPLMEKMGKCGNYDLMGGVVGVGIYLLLRYTTHPAHFRPLLSKTVDILYESAIFDNGRIKWMTIIDTSSKKWGCNLGMAHGIPGIIMFLRKLYLHGIACQKCRILIEGASAYLLSQMHSLQNHSSFYYDVVDLSDNGIDSRLSWCYGDLDVAYTFLLLSETKGLECGALRKTAYKILKGTTTKQKPVQAHVYDAGLCHGCCGLAHMYNRIYQREQSVWIKAAAQNWYKVGIHEMFDQHNGTYAGFQLPFFDDTDEQDKVDSYNLSFQTGIAGIALSLISYIKPVIPDWDYFLMLS